ncbi:MAG: hypothetical protein B6I23_00825 [Rickettsiaceae bacterium 4572_127]|nr:MAG: hypothetical protein B6I23_00825 [Rickettsiaceae bacterium 4572_127]
MLSTLFAVIIFTVVFSLLRTTHSQYFAVMKTSVIGVGGFFFFLLGLLPFFIGGFGIVLSIIGIAHRYYRPKDKIFSLEYQLGMALLLTLWGATMGYEILFVLLLPELADLVIQAGARIFKTKIADEKMLCHLGDLHDPLFKKRIGLHVILIFLSGGLVGISSQPLPVIVMAILATIFVYTHENKKEDK